MKVGGHDLDELMSDLLCSALEGGSNYWCTIKKLVCPKGKSPADYKFPHLELPFKGGSLVIEADEGPGTFTLNRKALDKGWIVFRDECARHYADAMCGTADATTGDVFLQACLFGKIIFG